MATYVLIHGAASDSWYWHRVAPLLRKRGHEVIAPDLPCDDDAAGFSEYADVVVEAIGSRRHLILVAQSLAGFTAPLVCDRLPVDLVVMLAAMVPLPGECGGEWWKNTGYEEARRDADRRLRRPAGAPFDVMELFFHDVPRRIVAEALKRGERVQSETPFRKSWPLRAWPEVPTRFLLCRGDRFFPAPFLRKIVKARLNIVPDEMQGGHLPALAHPQALVRRIEQYRQALALP